VRENSSSLIIDRHKGNYTSFMETKEKKVKQTRRPKTNGPQQHRHPNHFFLLSLICRQVVGSLERLQRELTSAQPAGHLMSLIHLPVAPYVTSTFPPVLLLLLFGSWPLVYGHPTRRGESRADGTYGKCSSRLLLRSSFAPSRTGTLSKFSVFFFFFERVCLFCINSNIVSTTVTWLHHGEQRHMEHLRYI
jgi:hypothetical protein